MSEAITSAGILWIRRRSPHLRLLRLCSPSQVRLGRVAAPVLSARTILMRY